MKFVCGLVKTVCDNTRSFWGFRHLKVNCNLSVKCKFNFRRLFGKLPRKNRHPMVKTSERFFLMGLLPRNVKSNRSEVHCKKVILKNIAKFTGRHLCWWLQSRCFPENFCEIFKNTYFVEHLGTVASETYTVSVSWKSFKLILGEAVQSSVSYLSILSLYLYRNTVYNRARSLPCCSLLEKCFMNGSGWASWLWKQKLAAKGLNS